MAFIDYYKILGVDKDIPQKDVRRAYLKRAKQSKGKSKVSGSQRSLRSDQ